MRDEIPILALAGVCRATHIDVGQANDLPSHHIPQGLRRVFALITPHADRGRQSRGGQTSRRRTHARSGHEAREGAEDGRAEGRHDAVDTRMMQV